MKFDWVCSLLEQDHEFAMSVAFRHSLQLGSCHAFCNQQHGQIAASATELGISMRSLILLLWSSVLLLGRCFIEDSDFHFTGPQLLGLLEGPEVQRGPAVRCMHPWDLLRLPRASGTCPPDLPGM